MPAITPPELPRLIVNGTDKHKYVFTYKNHWDADAKRSTRGKGDSKCVGKYLPIEGRQDCGEIIFNEEFKAQHPELDHLRVIRYKGGRLEFKPADEETAVRRPKPVERLHAGASWALYQIVGGTPLALALRETFPEHNTWRRLLSLVFYLVINRDSSLCNCEEFAECTWLPCRSGLTSGSISRLLRKISRDRIDRFLMRLNAAYQRERGNKMAQRRFWALDSTSITSYSENIASVEYGRNKDLIDAPQTNVLLIVDQKTGDPVYYRSFDGAVPDVSTIRNTLAELAMTQIDFSRVVLVTDKGYGSSANWDDLLRSSMSFISNARRGLNAAITQLIDEHYSELMDWNNGQAFIDQNAVTVPVEWRYDEFPVEGRSQQKKASHRLYVHLYYSKEINDEETRRLKARLFAAISQNRDDKDRLTEAQQKLLREFTIEKDGKVQVRMRKVDEKLRHSGIRVLVSDAIEDPVECCVAYEERNQVEYAFNTLKSRLSCNRTGVHSTEAWEGKLFLQMLATAVSGMVRARVRLYNDSARGRGGPFRLYFDSDHKLLAKLNNIYMTVFQNGWMFDEIVGKKKELFRILNVPVPTAEQVIERTQGAVEQQEETAFEEAQPEALNDGKEDL